MSIRFNNQNQSGDTIVEVLLAMVVIGIVLSASFGIANRSLAIGRASQERGEALKLAETQVELLKVEALKPTSTVTTRNSTFCIELVTSPLPDTNEVNDSNPSCTVDHYSVSIDLTKSAPPDPAKNFYKVTVNWERIGTNSTEPGELILYYKLGVL